MSRDLLSWFALLALVDLGAWAMVPLWADLSAWVSLAAGWCALSLLAVCALYLSAALGGSPGAVLQGARWPWLQPVFLPYRAAAWALFALARKTRRGEVMHQVSPGVFLGPRLFPGEAGELRRRGVTAVLDLTCELPANRALLPPAFVRWSVPVLDRAAPTDADLDAAVEAVREHLSRGEGVYVHCAFGRGRSAMVAAAVLLGLGECATADEAIARVAKARPQVRVRGVQREGLARYAARRADGSITGRNAVSSPT